MLKHYTSWNLPLLNQMFSEEEVQDIRGIPISRMGVQDRLVYNLTKIGNTLSILAIKLLNYVRRKCDGKRVVPEGERRKIGTYGLGF